VLTLLLPILFLGIPVVLAETTVDITWDGGGVFSTWFNVSDDATTYFGTVGSGIWGEFHGIDYHDNPYNYGVDTAEVKIKANVHQGYMEYAFTRTDSHEPMYGEAGQFSYTYIEADDGSFAWHTKSNYAKLMNCNYGWQNDNQIWASGNFIVHHELSVDADRYAYIHQEGSGETNITSMSEEAQGKTFKFGKGCGCYTNAKVSSSGSGLFLLYAKSPHIETDMGITVDGGDLLIQASYNNGFGMDNFALSGS